MVFIGKVKIWTQNLEFDVCTVKHTTATLLDQCLVLPFTDRPRTNIEEGTSLYSGILEPDVEGYKKMLCLSLQRWWNKLVPRVCQGVNCENPEYKDQNRERSLRHWEKLQCEKRNLSVDDCLGSTQECLSLTLVRCSGEQTLLGEYPQSLRCFSFVLII